MIESFIFFLTVSLVNLLFYLLFLICYIGVRNFLRFIKRKFVELR